MYKEKTAAQVAAYFLWKSKKPIKYIKLMKLMYFAEREFLLSYGMRITGDELFSMRFGPVLSNSLDNFQTLDLNPYWDQWLSSESDCRISLKKRNCNQDSFDHLSDAAIKVLDRVYDKYGNYEAFTLAELTHTKEHCPEWQDPGYSRLPLKIKDILMNHGQTEREAEITLECLREQDDYDRLISDLV